MESKHLMIIILGFLFMWFIHSAFTSSVNKEIAKIQETTKSRLDELKKEEREEEREFHQKMINKILDFNKTLLESNVLTKEESADMW